MKLLPCARHTKFFLTLPRYNAAHDCHPLWLRRGFATIIHGQWPHAPGARVAAPGRPGLCFLHGGSAHAHWFDAVAPAFADRYEVICPGSARARRERLAPAVIGRLGLRHGELRVRPAGSHGRARLEGDDALRAFDGRAQRDGLRRLASASRPGAGHHRQPTCHAVRAARRHASPRPPSVSGVTRRSRRRSRSFRLLPPRPRPTRRCSVTSPRRIVEREGRFLYRFDPATNGLRRPVDAWSLLHRITAPTLIVRGEHSPVLTRPMAEEMAAAGSAGRGRRRSRGRTTTWCWTDPRPSAPCCTDS